MYRQYTCHHVEKTIQYPQQGHSKQVAISAEAAEPLSVSEVSAIGCFFLIILLLLFFFYIKDKCLFCQRALKVYFCKNKKYILANALYIKGSMCSSSSKHFQLVFLFSLLKDSVIMCLQVNP